MNGELGAVPDGTPCLIDGATGKLRRPSGRFSCFADPGHAWLRVPLELIAHLGIGPQVSACSYTRGRWAYLEEDCDAPLFVRAYEARYGSPAVRSVTTDRRSRIREYASYGESP